MNFAQTESEVVLNKIRAGRSWRRGSFRREVHSRESPTFYDAAGLPVFIGPETDELD
jgi:hypothetical protein